MTNHKIKLTNPIDKLKVSPFVIGMQCFQNRFRYSLFVSASLNFARLILMMLISFLVLTNSLPACTTNSPKYPLGMYGFDGDMKFNSIDLSNDGTKAVIGGYCNDPNICGPDTPNPIISLFDTTSRTFSWKMRIPTTDS